MDSRRAEAIARQFIRHKHHKVERIFFKTMYPEENSWVLHGEVQFKRALFFTISRSFELRIDMDTGEVTLFKESPLSQPKTKQKRNC